MFHRIAAKRIGMIDEAVGVGPMPDNYSVLAWGASDDPAITPAAQPWLSQVFAFMWHVVTNGFRGWAGQLLHASRLWAFVKPDGCIRPIAVLDVFVRFTHSCVVEMYKPLRTELVGSMQMGCARPSGMETAVNIVRIANQRGKSVPKIDWKNAHNS